MPVKSSIASHHWHPHQRLLKLSRVPQTGRSKSANVYWHKGHRGNNQFLYISSPDLLFQSTRSLTNIKSGPFDQIKAFVSAETMAGFISLLDSWPRRLFGPSVKKARAPSYPCDRVKWQRHPHRGDDNLTHLKLRKLIH